MKKCLSIIVILLLGYGGVFANDFIDTKEVSLKKDEQIKIIVKYDSVEKLLKFRWTLYINGGLVLLKSYDKIVSQNILYLRHKNRSFRVELKPRGADYYNVPYLLVKFKKFDYELNRAFFELYLSDDNMQIQLKYLNNEEE